MRYKKIYNLIIFENGTIYRELKTKCKLIKPTAGSSGYWLVRINGKNMLAHRLIMEVFNGKSELTVDHIDGNKLNNSLDNLEYVTREENMRRSWKIGLRDNQRLKLKKPVIWNGILFESATELSKELGFCDSYVSQKIKKIKRLMVLKLNLYNITKS